MSPYRRMLIAGMVLLLLAGPAFADTISPLAMFVPGCLPLGLGLALPASLVAAILERPFISRTGVKHYALWYSIQANFISLLLGYLSLPLALFAVFTIGPLWSIPAVTVSILSEGLYYKWFVLGENDQVKWKPVTWANIFSSLVLLLIPFAVQEIKSDWPELQFQVAPYETMLFWGSAGGSLAVFAASFFVPALLQRRRFFALLTQVDLEGGPGEGAVNPSSAPVK